VAIISRWLVAVTLAAMAKFWQSLVELNYLRVGSGGKVADDLLTFALKRRNGGGVVSEVVNVFDLDARVVSLSEPNSATNSPHQP